MKVKDIMSMNVDSCTPDTRLPEVARKMVDCDCGAIPVVDPQSRRPVGMVTDRDIVCRLVAQNRNPLELSARDCMTTPAVTVTSETSLDECLELMEECKIRRVAVVDASSAICGIVAQADVAQHASKGDTAKVVRKVSEPSPVASVRS